MQDGRNRRTPPLTLLFLLLLAVSAGAQSAGPQEPGKIPAKAEAPAVAERLQLISDSRSGLDILSPESGFQPFVEPSEETPEPQGRIDWKAVVEQPQVLEGFENSFLCVSEEDSLNALSDTVTPAPEACESRSAPAKDKNSGLTASGNSLTLTSLSFPTSATNSSGELADIGDSASEIARFSSSLSPDISLIGLPQNPPDRFHWRAAFRQSFYSLVFMHAFRLAFDPYARYLVWHKPFWHDYSASADHFVMNRWGDGDDFLVNYIGHPMEGAVAGYIQIQNDPVGRQVKFSKTSAYWKSRLKALAWAAGYSTWFEIGPLLSEAALGNEGGYTYIKACDIPCWKKVHPPPTNNTGWVDFVVTPLIGTGWIILEDAIEREFVDRIAKGSNALKFELLRSALAPSHSFANFLQGREPWYRAKPPGETDFFNRKPGVPPLWQQETMARRWQTGIQFTSVNLPMDREGCSACRTTSLGVGGTFGYQLTPWLSFDSQTNYFPGGGGYGLNGSATEGLYGVRVGRRTNSWGFFVTSRPGFIHYDKVLTDSAADKYQSMTRFALDFGGTLEYYVSKRGAFRFEIGDTLVRYLTGEVDPRQKPVSSLSPDYIVTHSNFHIGTGYVVRF